jgi:hypothetical protein
MKQDVKLDVELIDELLRGRSIAESIAGKNGPLKQLTKAISECALAAELNAKFPLPRPAASWFS